LLISARVGASVGFCGQMDGRAKKTWSGGCAFSLIFVDEHDRARRTTKTTMRSDDADDDADDADG
jgi:hypothetical protein